MVRLVPKEAIGVWVLYTSVTAILEMMRAGFIKNPLISHLVSANDDAKMKVITTSFVLHIFLAFSLSVVLAAAAVPLATFWKSPPLEDLFFLYAVQNLALIPFFHFEYLQTAKLKFGGIFLCSVIRQAVPTFFLLYQYVNNQPTELFHIALFQILGGILGAIAAYPQVSDLMIRSLRFHRGLIQQLFHFGKYTFGTNVSSMVLRSTDSWIIGRFASTRAVAVYNPALKLANLFEVPTLAVSNFIFPQVSKKMRQNGKAGIRDIYTKSVSLMVALSLPMLLPLYFFSDFFVTLIFGQQYAEAADILEVTIFYSLIIPFNRQFGTILDALKKPKLNFYTLILTGVINAVLNVIFLKWFGIIGCAYATLVSFLLVFMFNQYVLNKHFGINTLDVVSGVFRWYGIGWNLLTGQLAKVRS
jgi:O-antigen/teichoic acid export membrane protein